MDKSRMSRICKALDEVVEKLRNRPVEGDYPYLWLGALYPKVRQNQCVVSMALVIAVGVGEEGERALLGFDAGGSEEEAFWKNSLCGLKKRELKGVQLVISNAHGGLKQAIKAIFAGASWQCCRLHSMRNVLAHIPKGDRAMVAAAIRTIFAQPNREAASQQSQHVAQTMQPHWPKASQVLLAGEQDILAYMAFPKEHWTRIYSTNILERLNKKVKCRIKVVEIFPDVPSVIRLVGALLAEIDDEWQVGRSCFSKDSMRKLNEPELGLLPEPTPLWLAPVR